MITKTLHHVLCFLGQFFLNLSARFNLCTKEPDPVKELPPTDQPLVEDSAAPSSVGHEVFENLLKAIQAARQRNPDGSFKLSYSEYLEARRALEAALRGHVPEPEFNTALAALKTIAHPTFCDRQMYVEMIRHSKKSA